MMSVSLHMTLLLSLLSVVFGCLAATLGMRWFALNRGQAPIAGAADSPDQNNRSVLSDVERRISTLYQLTSRVGTQVNEHSLQVSEITGSIASPKQIEAALIIVAGNLLLTANQKLQADLEEAKQEIQLQNDQLSTCMQESLTDSLTQLSNRRALDQELVRIFATYRRFSTCFSLMLIDIDHFKRVNDQYGHMVGDQLLKIIARNLTNTFRESDFVSRYGGEEFVAILPKTSIDEACRTAERVRKGIGEKPYKVGEFEFTITASVGITEIVGGDSEKDLLQKADEALYSAKKGGRNSCYFHDGKICRRYDPVTESTNVNAETAS